MNDIIWISSSYFWPEAWFFFDPGCVWSKLIQPPLDALHMVFFFTSSFLWYLHLQLLGRKFIKNVGGCIDFLTLEDMRSVLVLQHASCHTKYGPIYSFYRAIMLWCVGWGYFIFFSSLLMQYASNPFEVYSPPPSVLTTLIDLPLYFLVKVLNLFNTSKASILRLI